MLPMEVKAEVKMAPEKKKKKQRKGDETLATCTYW